MPHADTSLVPESITTKKEFWTHVLTQLEYLIEGSTNWVSNLANASALIYHSLQSFPSHFGPDEDKAVNWAGFYLHSRLYPPSHVDSGQLLVGPFVGKPACQFINVAPGKAKGVCADAYTQKKTVIVPDVEQYPGHIACDGGTRSEIVVPLLVEDGGAIGVLDLDCLAAGGFDEVDKEGLERIAAFLVKVSKW